MLEQFKKEYLYGSLAAFLSAVGFGSLPIFAVNAYDAGVNVISLLTFRFVISAIILGILNFKKFDIKEIVDYNFSGLILIGITYAIFNFSYFTAFNLIPTSLAALIFYTYPILVALLAWLLGQEVIGLRKGVAVFIAFTGIYLVYSDFQIVASGIGLMMAVMASLFYAFYILGGNYLLADTQFLHIIFVTCFISAILFAGTGLVRGELGYMHGPNAFIYLSLITIISLISLILFLYGVKYTTPTVASVVSMAEPVVTVLLSFILLAESFSIIQYGGALMILLASLYIVLAGQIK
ncbi:DMT family transporter [Halanaerobiaceae bacterium Z-7014]|uniref:DMT family transporter n=1 Tax=Halonatronomonas betaini TaxID=2778430 RepID=A0A931AU10_9FIRM|nr:DMT family transporter [Halonatronomonas betaini]MBF8436460.1 DMT family transporter [Halonatronomonas betaini]